MEVGSKLFLSFSPSRLSFPLSAYPRFDTEARGNSEMTYLHLFQTIAQNVGTSLLIHIQRGGKSECELAKKSSQ